MKSLFTKNGVISICANPQYYDYLSSLRLDNFSKRFELTFGDCQAVKLECKGNFILGDDNKLILEFETEREGYYKKYYRKHYLNYQIIDERKEHNCGYGGNSIYVSQKTIIFDKSPFQFNNPRAKYDPNDDYCPSVFYFDFIDKRYEKKEKMPKSTISEVKKEVEINDSKHNNLAEVDDKDKKLTYADIVRKKKANILSSENDNLDIVEK
jgi:hypothetical protein